MNGRRLAVVLLLLTGCGRGDSGSPTSPSALSGPLVFSFAPVDPSAI